MLATAPGAAAPPPAPASSLNSMASYTSQPGFGPSSGAGAPQGRYARPLITPATSFRGWPSNVGNGSYNAASSMSAVDEDASGESSAQAVQRALGTITPSAQDDDECDYGAFQEDAFAPLTTAKPQQERDSWLSNGINGAEHEGGAASREGPPRPRSVHEIGRSSDSWSAFRSSPTRTSVWSNFESRNRSGSSLGSFSGASASGLQMTSASPTFGQQQQMPAAALPEAQDSNRTARPGNDDFEDDQDMDGGGGGGGRMDEDDEMGDEQPRSASGRVARLWQGRLRNRRD